ncbi:MAG TPA: LytR C-terminal domain-containing protein [Actinomycetales bacterium]|nr:LytR C-terminal domain-containing protein [Actinomycetales bacterium]
MTRTYPPDEFDVDDSGTGRRGAHRAKPNPLVAVVPLVLVTVAVVAVLVGTMTLLGGPGDAPTSGDDPAASDPAASEPAASEPAEPTASETTAPPSETTTEPAEPEPTVDQSLPVTVLNGVGVAGLAGDTADLLTGAGFNVVGTDNFTGGEAPPTTVFYASEEQSATADAIVGELGVGVTELDPAMGEGLTVVLGEDYQP